jgi:hypothetical protein
MPINKIVIHHSASAPSTTWEQINQWHRDRGFTKSSLGYYIGYHYVIFPDGIIRQAREDVEIGCHSIPNNGKIGICLVGDFTKTQPYPLQLKALWNYLDILLEKYRMLPEAIYNHCELSQTACPGSIKEKVKIYRKIGVIKELLRKLIIKQKETYMD